MTPTVASKGADMVYTQGTYNMTVSDPKGKYLTVWAKQADGSWKAVEDIFNSGLPLTSPPK